MLSVIIPIYNVEKYLSKCLNSCNQAKKDHQIEFLLINDGSTDNSGEIAKKFCDENSDFKYHLKINGGLSDARNYGLSNSKYDYIFYLDSDDTITEDSFDLIFEGINKKVDLVIFDMLFVWENSDETKYLKCFDNSDNYIKQLLLKSPSACNKVFKKKILKDNLFPVGL